MRRVRFAAIAGVLAVVVATGQATAQSGGTPPDGVVADGVSVEGVAIGGLTVADAVATLKAQLVKPRMAPIRLVLRGRAMDLKPSGLGLTILVTPTIQDAMAYGRTKPITAPVDIALRQRVDRDRLLRLLRLREGLVRTPARNVILSWQGLRPKIWPAKVGYAIRYSRAVGVVADALVTKRSGAVRLPYRILKPTVVKVGVVLVVDRATRRLTMYSGERRIRTFSVAVGTPTYPTPRGLFRVVNKQTNPAWFPPDSPWAAGLGPIPPGPGNPLGTRWIGTSAPGIGIHGTYADWSVGTAASHGCLRMHIADVEWLYNYVKVGTVVRIV